MAETYGQMMTRLRKQEAESSNDTLNLDAPAAAPEDSPAPEVKLAPADPAMTAHIAAGIRKKFADRFNFGALSDQEVIQRHFARFGQGMSPVEYNKKLEDVYGKDLTPPAAAAKPKTFGEKAGEVGNIVRDAATSIVPFAIPEVAKHALPLISKSIPGASQIGFLAGHTVGAALDVDAARRLEKVADKIIVPDLGPKITETYNLIQPSLAAKGWSDEDIMTEARDRAKNIVQGQQRMKESLDAQVQDRRRMALEEPAKAAADAFFLGVSPRLIGGIIQGSLAKLGIQATIKPATGLVGNVITHAAGGAAIGGLGMGIEGAATHATLAAVEQKRPDEIAQELIKGGKAGFKTGAIGGAIIGGSAGLAMEGAGRLLSPLKKGKARAALREQIAANEADDARLQGWSDRRQQQDALREMYESNAVDREKAALQEKTISEARSAELKRAAILRTAKNFDPHALQIDPNADPSQVAMMHLMQEHGEDALMTETGLRAATEIEDRIKIYKDANEDLRSFNNRQLPSDGSEQRQPQLGPNLGPVETGGQEPAQVEPNPLGPTIDTTPAPEAPPVAPAPITQPLKPRETNMHAQHVVETYKQANGFKDQPDREVYPQIDQVRAQSIAQAYHEMKSAAPGTPEFDRAKKSYDSLNKEISQQYKAIRQAGFKIEFVDKDPYKNSAEMRKDVRENKRLKVLKTAEGHHPFMSAKQNDQFRAVHDFFGHAAEGFEFGPRGEEAAYRQHAATLSNASIPALTTETRGQNSWVNFLPENAALEPSKRPFAEQKFGLLPTETYADVLHPDTANPVRATPSIEGPVVKAVPTNEVPAAPSSPTAGQSSEPVAQAASSSEPVANKTQAALKTIGTLEHADVEATPEGALKITRLGRVSKPGGTPQDLDAITKAADQHNVSIETEITPPPGIKGGHIPLEKVIPWYEARGFRVTETTKIPEGNLASAKLVRDPIGQHQSDVATRLEQVAENARKRINAKTGKLNAGFDPTLIGDYALELAADMFSKSLRKKGEIASWLAEKYGEDVKPFIGKITELAQKHFVRMFKGTGTAEKNLRTLLALGESGKHGADWYEGTADWAKQNFGPDADMMLRFLAVTSANGQTESGAALALKAFAQWKSGMPFEGFRGDSMVGQLTRTAAGESLGDHTKIQNFYDALAGDPNAIVLDRWMIDALNLKERGGSLRENDYRIYAKVVSDLAKMNDMTPRQFQAAIWEGARIRKAHTSEASVGRALTTKIGSARPLEDLVQNKLGGMSIDQYIEATKGNLQSMEHLYQGLEPVRKGDESGHTFDLQTYEPSKQPGYVVSLVSTNVPKKILYPAELLKFRRQVEPLIADLQKGDLFNDPAHVTIGVFASDAHPGMFSIDLNVTLPSQERALQIGKLNRQESIAHLGPGGEWIENVPTGYNEKKHGPQFLPPEGGQVRAAWFKQQMARVKAFLKMPVKMRPAA